METPRTPAELIPLDIFPLRMTTAVPSYPAVPRVYSNAWGHVGFEANGWTETSGRDPARVLNGRSRRS